jgi:hypothetical protein
MADTSQPKRPEPEPIPNLMLPETTHEPFPLIAKLIRFIQQKRK